MAGRVLPTITFGVLLVAITFGVLAMNLNWADAEDLGGDGGFGALTVRQSFADSSEVRAAYTGEGFDDVDGIGMIRAGGVLFLIGIVTAGLAALAVEHRLVLGRAWLNVATLAVSGLASILLVVAVILLPIGIAEFAKSPNLGGAVDIRWVFGLYAGVVAAAGTLAATVLAAVTVLQTTGFRLEAADAAADFDA